MRRVSRRKWLYCHCKRPPRLREALVGGQGAIISPRISEPVASQRASILLELAPIANAEENLGSECSNVSYNSELS